MQSNFPFHLAFVVHNLEATEDFYVRVLGARAARREGGENPRWIDFDFYGHQISAHLGPNKEGAITNPVDGDAVPVPHFGVILPPAEWELLKTRVESAGVAFILGPRTRFSGEAGEQRTFFIQDPSGNALEFKSFESAKDLFRT
jgi:extradiol dioxygenase family protein